MVKHGLCSFRSDICTPASIRQVCYFAADETEDYGDGWQRGPTKQHDLQTMVVPDIAPPHSFHLFTPEELGFLRMDKHWTRQALFLRHKPDKDVTFNLYVIGIQK
jgi:hypothetical protein